jgi:hypothetical protein
LHATDNEFIFESTDQQWALKLIRWQKLPLYNLPLPTLPSYWSTQTLKESKRIQRLFESYLLGLKLLKPECALHYLHLQSTGQLLPTLRISDKLGRVHTLNPNELCFLIQKKSVPTYDYLNQLFKKRAYKKIELALYSLSNLYLSAFEKGLCPLHSSSAGQIGFIDDTPIFTNIADFYVSDEIKKETVYLQKEETLLKPLQEWLQPKLPQELEYLADCLKF